MSAQPKHPVAGQVPGPVPPWDPRMSHEESREGDQ